jgi:hypothetical protein
VIVADAACRPKHTNLRRSKRDPLRHNSPNSK